MDEISTHPKHEADDNHALASRRIAYSLIVVFSAGLAFVLLGAIVFETGVHGDPGPWLEIFKSGFLILGGSLSSIVGYYFGSRGTQIAEESVRTAQAKLEQRTEALEGQEALASRLLKQLDERELLSIEDEGFIEGADTHGVEEAFPEQTTEQGGAGA